LRRRLLSAVIPPEDGAVTAAFVGQDAQAVGQQARPAPVVPDLVAFLE
jgi:hypothetical protein